MTLPLGHLLAGKYRIERQLGEGAMGQVLAARHVDLDELRAIKLMLPSKHDDAEGAERFLREARAAVKLKSPHVCKVLDVGRLEDGAPYFVMELLEGDDLKNVLNERGPLPIGEAVLYAVQACEALGEAHALGIVHRDVKLANLFVTKGPNNAPWIKVLDFGIAKMSSTADPAKLELTKTSDVIGTPVYMSPEQMRATKDVDARTDLWSLGVVLYASLTGKLPFAGDTVTQVCAAVIADPPIPPSTYRPDLPAALEAAILRCLEKDPNRRFASASDLAAAIAPFALPVPAADATSRALALSQAGAEAALAAQQPSSAQQPPSGQNPPSVQQPSTLSDGLTTKSSATWAAAPTPQAPLQTGRDPSSLVLVAVGALSLVALGVGVFLLFREPTKPTSAATTSAAVTATTVPAETALLPSVIAPPPPTSSSEAPPMVSAKTPPPLPSASPRADKPSKPARATPPPAAPQKSKDAFGEDRR